MRRVTNELCYRPCRTIMKTNTPTKCPMSPQLRANRLGLWLFFLSELFLFGALLAARFVLWGNTRPDLSQEIGLDNDSDLVV